jgi:type 1 glutamine amidotransferase
MKKKALIVYGGWEGHSPAETSDFVAHELRSVGFEVVLSDSLGSFLDETRLKTYDLIVPNWTMGNMTGDHEGPLVRAIESGVGLGGFHGGMGDAFRSATAFQFMVGGQFVAHPDNGKDYTVRIVKRDDPIVAGLSDFSVHSEQYFMHADPSNEVLATTTFQTKEAPWINGTVMPVVWKRKYGQGRVFYQSIGHGTKELEIPEVREITKRGLVWAAR